MRKKRPFKCAEFSRYYLRFYQDNIIKIILNVIKNFKNRPFGFKTLFSRSVLSLKCLLYTKGLGEIDPSVQSYKLLGAYLGA